MRQFLGRCGAGLAALMVLGAPGAECRSAPPAESWRGVHLMAPGHEGVPLLKRTIDEALAPLGVNVLVLEVNYQFTFRKHPELGQAWGITWDDARELAAVCKSHNIRLIPQFNCLGHQSWSRHTFSLLTQHPEFDETPHAPADNKGLYCRSWCPRHPGVNPIVFDLCDELAEAFQADAFHVGMDEVFLIASDDCPRCKGADPAELFARVVNDLHQHLVTEKKLTMLMWADRLIDDRKMHYGKWEASQNGTAAAIDKIDKDIVLCDWHYERRDSYPSVHYFQDKGFRVWPSSWKKKDAALALLQDARKDATDRMLGQLCTTWMGSDLVCRALLGETTPAGKRGDELKGLVEAIKAVMGELKPAKGER